MKLLITSGHGTKLKPLVHTYSIQLLLIANKPISQYCVESIKNDNNI